MRVIDSGRENKLFLVKHDLFSTIARSPHKEVLGRESDIAFAVSALAKMSKVLLSDC